MDRPETLREFLRQHPGDQQGLVQESANQMRIDMYKFRLAEAMPMETGSLHLSHLAKAMRRRFRQETMKQPELAQDPGWSSVHRRVKARPE